jgi:hypothetical protein
VAKPQSPQEKRDEIDQLRGELAEARQRGSRSSASIGEHAIEWGAQAAVDTVGPSSGLKPACQERKACSSVSFRTATRTVRNG